MTRNPLQNYLRTFRRRFGFSQKEIAILLGSKSGTKVSRYERSARVPRVHTAWTFEVLFNKTASEIFAGHFQTIRTTVRKRAKALIEELATTPKSEMNAQMKQKLLFLQSLVEPKDNVQSD